MLEKYVIEKREVSSEIKNRNVIIIDLVFANAILVGSIIVRIITMKLNNIIPGKF